MDQRMTWWFSSIEIAGHGFAYQVTQTEKPILGHPPQIGERIGRQQVAS
jgi:hypothetical protein